MRLLRIGSNYPVFLHRVYHKYPGLDVSSYADQQTALMQESFGWADAWKIALEPFGYEVWEPVANARPAQAAWAREAGCAFDETEWIAQVTAAQVKAFRPDILFVNDYSTFSPDFIRRLRAECPSIRLIVAWCGAPYPNGDFFKACDLVLSNIPQLVDHFRAGGLDSEHLHHAFNPVVNERLKGSAHAATDFSFVGSLNTGNGAHLERERLLVSLADHLDLTVWADVQLPAVRDRIRLRAASAAYHVLRAAEGIPGGRALFGRVDRVRRLLDRDAAPSVWDSGFVHPSLACHIRPPVYGLEMFAVLAGSKITLNSHTQISAKNATNMRLFEATGVGTCLLTEWMPDLGMLFEADTEVVTYRSAGEAIDKAKYLLEHDTERLRIAEAGQARTLKEHTFSRRAQVLTSLLDRRLRERTLNSRLHPREKP